jgi:hypothetical protein
MLPDPPMTPDAEEIDAGQPATPRHPTVRETLRRKLRKVIMPTANPTTKPQNTPPNTSSKLAKMSSLLSQARTPNKNEAKRKKAPPHIIPTTM